MVRPLLFADIRGDCSVDDAVRQATGIGDAALAQYGKR
jgi:hypothetical protein